MPDGFQIRFTVDAFTYAYLRWVGRKFLMTDNPNTVVEALVRREIESERLEERFGKLEPADLVAEFPVPPKVRAPK